MEVGYNVRITCNVVRSNPRANSYRFTWIRVDKNLTRLRTSPTLEFEAIKMEEITTYRCLSSNGVLMATSDITLYLVNKGQLSNSETLL